MKPHPRFRKTIKWGGSAVAVLLVVVWIGSGWWYLEWGGPERPGDPQFFGVVIGGQIVIARQASPRMFVVETGVYVDRVQPRSIFGWFGIDRRPSRLTAVVIPIWSLAAIAAAASGIAWRRDAFARRQASVGHCPSCKYDRAGIAGDAKCPECGANGSVSKPTESATHA